MDRNSEGKVLTVFLIVVAVLLISLTAISIFFFQKEIEKREHVEEVLKTTQQQLAQVDTDLQETKKQKVILEEKRKELSDRIEDITNDLELEKGLKEESKKENSALNDKLKEANDAQNQLRKQIAEELKASEDKIKELQTQVETEINNKTTLQQQLTALQSQAQELQTQKENLEKQVTELKNLQVQTAAALAPAAASGTNATTGDKRIKELEDQLNIEKKIKVDLQNQLKIVQKEKGKVEAQLAKFKNKKNKNGAKESTVNPAQDEKASEDLEQRLNAEVQKKTELEQKVASLEDKNTQMEAVISDLKQQMSKQTEMSSKSVAAGQNGKLDIELEPIVVSPGQASVVSAAPDAMSEGKILSVDMDVEFVIVNLGSKDGMSVGKIMSVSRDNKNLGEIKITRVLPEMSAADLIPPLTAKDVRKDDQVVVKK